MKHASLIPGLPALGPSKDESSADDGVARLSREQAQRQVQDLEGGFCRVALKAQREALAAGVGYTTIVHGIRVKITPE